MQLLCNEITSGSPRELGKSQADGEKRLKREECEERVGKCTSRSGKISEHDADNDEDDEHDDRQTSAELSLLFYHSLPSIQQYFDFTLEQKACKFSDSQIPAS